MFTLLTIGKTVLDQQGKQFIKITHKAALKLNQHNYQQTWLTCE